MFLFCRRIYFIFISCRESYNSSFLLVNLPFVLLISLSKTSSSYTCLNSELVFWDLGWSLNSSTSATNLHGLIDEVKNATWRTDRSSFAPKIWPNCWKRGLRDGFVSPNMWHLGIKWKRFLYIIFLWEKTYINFLELIFICPIFLFQKHVSNREILRSEI